MITLEQAVKKLPPDLQAYLKFKFPNDIANKGIVYASEEEFLKARGKKTMLRYKQFEQTPHYQAIVTMIYLNRAMRDLQEIYDKVVEQAKNGDEKAIKLFLLLQKEMKQSIKGVDKLFSKRWLKNQNYDEPEEVEEEDDGLVLD